MLGLLGRLLPPERLNGPARTGPRELHVQLYLDRGNGPGMIRLSLSGQSGPGPRTGIPAVTVDSRPDNCIPSKGPASRPTRRAAWPGTAGAPSRPGGR